MATELEYEGLTVVFTDSEGNKKGKKRTIIHPIFYVMAEECDDPFWKYKLIEFSVGKMPTRYRYIPESRMLAYKKRTKDFTVEFLAEEETRSSEEETDSTELVAENIQRFKDFMRNTTGVISPDEAQEDLPETDAPREKKTWAQVMKSKNLSIHYINEYCKAIREEYNLDPVSYNSLLYAVDDLRLSGAISKCVSFNGDEITEIGNIYQDSETGYFYSIPERPKKATTKKGTATRGSKAVRDIWEKVREIYTDSISAAL